MAAVGACRRRCRARPGGARWPADRGDRGTGHHAAATAINGRSPRKTSRQWTLRRRPPRGTARARRGSPSRRQRREHLGSQPIRQGPPDRDVGDRRDRAGPEALEDPADDEDPHRRRQAADEQPGQTGRARAGTAGSASPRRSGLPRRRSRGGCRGRSPRTPSRTGRGRLRPVGGDDRHDVATARASEATSVTSGPGHVSDRWPGDQRPADSDTGWEGMAKG